MTTLRKALTVPLPVQLRFAVTGAPGARVVAGIVDGSGMVTELREPPLLSSGEHAILAVVHGGHRLSEHREMTFVGDGPRGRVIELSGPAAGSASQSPVFVVGECVPGDGGWRFRTLGYDLDDGVALADRWALRGAVRDGLTTVRPFGPAVLPPAPSAVPLPKHSSVPPGPAPSGPGPERIRGLSGARLDGVRQAGGPVRLDVAVDVSLSMKTYSSARRVALAELFAFARRELSPDDLIAVAAFAGRAAPILPPSRVGTLGEASDRPRGGLSPEGTELSPAIRLLRKQTPPSPIPRSLVVVSDGELFDNHRELAYLLKRASYHEVHFVAPNRHVPAAREPWFRSVALHLFTGPAELAHVYAAVFASLTGQRLVGR